MKVSSLFSGVAAAAMLMAGMANAASVQLIGIQNGDGSLNCGSGKHSTYLGSTVAELTFDTINNANSVACAEGANPGAPANYGDLGSQLFSTPLGSIGLSGSGDIVAGTQSGVAAMPWADNTPYLVVGVTPDTATINFSGLATPVNYFGFYWGSVDTGNSITFTLSDNTSVVFSGFDLPGAATALSYNGNNQFQYATNIFVDFLATGASITSVNFADSPSPAFELDNVAFGSLSVPEPLALALLGLGLGGLGVMRRRRT